MTTVAFDLFSTLIPGLDASSSNPQRWENDVSVSLGLKSSGFASLFSVSASGREIGEVDFREALASTALALGATPSHEQVETAWLVCVDSIRGALALPRPGALETLEALRRRGYRLVLCSNASADAASAFRGSPLAVLFDDLVFSCEVGVVKPHPTMYARVGTSGYFVGDGGSNELTGAQDAGLHAIQVPAYQGTTAPVGFWSAWRGTRVSSFEDLLSVIPATARQLPPPGR